jgi:RHS repeat-associated protein
MYITRFIFLIFTLFSTVFAAEDLQELEEHNLLLARGIQDHVDSVPLLADLNCEPSSFVNGVNVITGAYNVMVTDVNIPGPESFCLSRHYSSSGSRHGDLCHGWNFNHQGELTIKHVNDPSSCYATLREGFGSIALFESNKHKKITLSLSKKSIARNVTNSSNGQISARSNIKNISIVDVKNKSRECTVREGSGGTKFYKRKHPHSETEHPFYLQKDLKPSGNAFVYMHEEHKPHRAIKIGLVNANNLLLSSISINYSDNLKKTPYLQVITSDKRRVNYKFKHFDNADLLTKVERSDAPTEIYKYDKYGQMTSKILPEGRYQKISYYDNVFLDQDVGGTIVKLEGNIDQKPHRVKFQQAPVGPDDQPIITHRYFYHITPKPNEDKPGKYYPGAGVVDVRDVYNKKTEYHFTDDQRLSGIFKFSGPSGQQSLYSEEHLYWGLPGTKDHTNLISRTFSSKTSGMQFCRNYIYDNLGNITCERLFGNLTGNNPYLPSVTPQGMPATLACDCYMKSYTYSNDGFNLLLSEGDLRHNIYYSYFPGTDLLASKIKGGASPSIRQFYEYDLNGILNKEIIDDGTTNDKFNLTNVTERRIKYITPRQTEPIGLPEVIEERALNVKTGQEFLLSKVVNSYSSKGILKKQDRFDSNGVYVSTSQWDHDERNNIILEIDPLGRTKTYKYDANNNKIFEQGPRTDSHKEFVYDYSNRLIRIDEVHTSYRLSKTFRYDLLGNKIASTDIYGNETQFIYDDFSRLITKIYPAVLNENGVLVNPTEHLAYDAMSNPIAKNDANGNLLTSTYTVRGQPSLITYSDGTQEQTLYYLDGAIKQSISRNHLYTFHPYVDYQGRPGFTTYYSEHGHLLDWKSTTYNAFHLLNETNMSGLQTSYTYDFAGRLSSITKQDRLTTYEYDPLGRLHKTCEFFDANNFIAKINEFDVLDRVIEERVEDADGNIVSRMRYGYDIQGHRNEIRNFTAAGEAVSTIVYNSHDQPCLLTDALGNSSITVFRYDYLNSLGQKVPYNEMTDPMGNFTTTTYDALGRVASIVKKNGIGKIIQSNEMAYDCNGNRISLKETVIIDNGSDRIVQTNWTYDSLNRVTSVTEAVGSPEQKKTSIHYNSFGQKESIVNPDGVVISHSYDYLGRLISFSASDNSFHYTYEFDLNNNPIKINDLINGTTTVKVYDSNNRVIEETLGNGLVMRFQYDRMDRPLKITIPDNSSIEYLYGAMNLKQVSRHDSSGNLLYAHSYTGYDHSGNLLNAQLIKEAGCINYQYDTLGRPTYITAPHWQSSISQYDKVGNIIEREVTDKAGHSHCAYRYDNLYQLQHEEGFASHTYANDSLYNRINKDGSNYTVNNLNQLLSDSKNNYSYDTNGNLILQQNEDGKTVYTFDALGRLVTATTSSKQVKYTYDDTSRRLSKTISLWDPPSWNYIEQETQRFFFDGQKEIGYCDSIGVVQQFRVLGSGKGAEIGAAVALELHNQVYVPIHDHNGNVVTLLDSNGNIAEIYRYSAFGEEQVFDANGEMTESINPWRFSSKRYDPETGFIYFGKRYYNPEIGRWITPDPKGFEAGPNLYAYVSNNPLTHCDLYGLIEFSLDFNWGGGAPTVKNDIFTQIGNGLCELTKMAGTFIEALGRQVPIPVVRDYIETLGHHMSGKEMKGWMPSSKLHSSWAEFHPGDGTYNEALVAMNGVETNLRENHNRCQDLQQRSHNHPAIYCFNNATHGLILDFAECILQALGIPTNSTQVFKRGLETLANKMNEVGPGGVIRVFPHSQSGGIMYELGSQLSECIKDMIEVTAFGPARLIPDKMYKRADNYVGSREFVTLTLNPIACLKAKLTNDPSVHFVKTVGPIYEAHSYNGETYANILHKKLSFIYDN